MTKSFKVLAIAGFASCMAWGTSISMYSVTQVSADESIAAPAGIVTTLGPDGGGGMLGGPLTFTLAVPTTLDINVTDEYLVGDVFEVILNGTSLGTTSAVALGGPTNSTGDFIVSLPAGTDSLDVEDILLSYVGLTDPYGGGTVPVYYTPAAFSIDIIGAPEPGSFVLMGGGLLGLAGFARRRFAK